MGRKKGDNIRIFPIDIDVNPDENPIKMRRHQLPLRLSYANTFHKSQGQTFNGRVGLLLKTPVFDHGQLYTGCSRVTNPSNLYIELSESDDVERMNVTKNVVYTEIFDT